MPIRRVFIDWCRPTLASAADYLLERYAHGGEWNLEPCIVAVPGGRAGRRLLELLVERAERQSLMLVPPEIMTTGHFPETLYTAKLPFADDLTQQLAWIEALRSFDRARLTKLIRAVPDDDDHFAWLALAEMLANLHRELAGEALSCADVAAKGSALKTFNEVPRWQLLAELEDRYLRVLDAAQLWDLQTARLFANEHGECRTDRDIILAGTVDMNRTQRAMLDQVADRVTALVFAPESMADRFDEHGCVLPDAWKEVTACIDPTRVDIVEGPGDRATATARAIASFGGQYSAPEIVVGVPDKRILSQVVQRLEECEVPVRYGVGISVTETEPCRLLRAVGEFVDGRRFRAFAALLRHPAVERWLRANGCDGDWLTELDTYYGTHLPRRVTGKWLAIRNPCKAAPQAYEKLVVLLEELSGPPQPVSQWGPSLVQLLVATYGGRELDRNDPRERLLLAACEQIAAAARAHGQIPAALAPKVSASEAVRLILRDLEGATIPPHSEGPAVELIGWLDLLLDDAPAVVVTGFNEGVVPSVRNGDTFLPNELRRHLRLEDNDLRYARDVYGLSLLSACKPDLRIIAGRRTSENDPLIPSRLLFLCEEENLAERTIRLLSPSAAERPRLVLPGGLKPGKVRAEFHPPEPWPLAEPVQSMRVTEFKTYLACPYRYYLKHRLDLKAFEDVAEELDGGQFGTLLHDVLIDFKDDVSAETNPRAIEDDLSRRLDRLANKRFGVDPLPAVSVQIEMVRLRLRAFAEWQAEWARAGWRVRETEFELPEPVALEVDGESMFLRGRIDRIDVNERTGRCIIFDYKTGDAARPPDKTHRHKESWIDLQLPLYRFASTWLDVGSDVEVGYILIPKDTKKVSDARAPWSPSEFDGAIEVARDVIRQIRKETFWPPISPAPAFFEEFAAICGDMRFGSTPTDDDEDA